MSLWMGCLGRWWSHHPWRCSRKDWPWQITAVVQLMGVLRVWPWEFQLGWKGPLILWKSFTKFHHSKGLAHPRGAQRPHRSLPVTINCSYSATGFIQAPLAISTAWSGQKTQFQGIMLTQASTKSYLISTKSELIKFNPCFSNLRDTDLSRAL